MTEGGDQVGSQQIVKEKTHRNPTTISGIFFDGLPKSDD